MVYREGLARGLPEGLEILGLSGRISKRHGSRHDLQLRVTRVHDIFLAMPCLHHQPLLQRGPCHERWPPSNLSRQGCRPGAGLPCLCEAPVAQADFSFRSRLIGYPWCSEQCRPKSSGYMGLTWGRLDMIQSQVSKLAASQSSLPCLRLLLPGSSDLHPVYPRVAL